jgi:hypothetical protein
MLTHPTLDLLHDLGLHGMAKGFKALNRTPKRALSNMPNGSLSCLNTNKRCAGRSASRRAPKPRVCVTTPASRTLIIAPRAGSTAPCSSSSQVATSFASDAIC